MKKLINRLLFGQSKGEKLPPPSIKTVTQPDFKPDFNTWVLGIKNQLDYAKR